MAGKCGRGIRHDWRLVLFFAEAIQSTSTDHLLGRLVDSKCTELCERWHSINKTKKGIGSAIEQHCKKGTTRGRNNPIVEMKNILGTMAVPCPKFNCMQAFWSASSAHMHWCQTHRDKRSESSSKCPANGCLYVAKGFEQAVKHCAEHEDLWAKVSEDHYTKLICPLKDCTWFIIGALDSKGFFSEAQGHSQSHKPNHKPKQVKGVKPEDASDKCEYTCNLVGCGKSKPATAKASWMDWRRRQTAIHLKLLDKHLRHRSQRATGTEKGRVEFHLCNTTFMVAAGCLDDHIQRFHPLEWIQRGRQILAEMETNGD
jgi:hypothetical protein